MGEDEPSDKDATRLPAGEGRHEPHNLYAGRLGMVEECLDAVNSTRGQTHVDAETGDHFFCWSIRVGALKKRFTERNICMPLCLCVCSLL